jgi:tetratricopeptide (TPR) repeat protein
MTEDEFIDEIDRLWVAGRYADALRVVEKAVVEYPESVDLLCSFGDLIQLSNCDVYKLADALSAYERAIALDPQWAEPYEEVGYYWDNYFDDFARAEVVFRKAIELGAGAHSYAGLARVLAERGTGTAEVLAFLDGCPYVGETVIQEMRSEIEKGLWAPIRQP